MNPSARAFTLIELLTVITIIGILSAIVIPVVGRVRESARDAQCKSNLRQYGAAVALYVADNKQTYPSGDNPLLTQELAPYLKPNKPSSNTGTSLDECPSRTIINPNPGEIDRSYGAHPDVFVDANAKSRARASIITRPTETILLMDACQRSNGKAHMRMGKLVGNVSDVPGKADDFLPDSLNVDRDGGNDAIFRFRHHGQRANAVRADASVVSVTKGTLQNRHFALAY
jgi:prepilin-type N-terminal cleavage/methylation domain